MMGWILLGCFAAFQRKRVQMEVKENDGKASLYTFRGVSSAMNSSNVSRFHLKGLCHHFSVSLKSQKTYLNQ